MTKKIRKLNPYQRLLPATDGAYVAFTGVTAAQLRKIGFTDDATEGTTILPKATGRITKYNAEGKFLKKMNAPLETVYHTMLRHWKDWHGNDHSGLVDMPYKRRPRLFVAPPSVELTLYKNQRGDLSVLSTHIGDWKNNETQLIHTINIFLELFGQFTILDDSKSEAITSKIKRVNWRILPKGEYPFERVKQELEPILRRTKRYNQFFVSKRLERLNEYKPDFYVQGIGGFSGYVVAAYPKRDLYVLESLLYGNATYVLNKDWDTITKLTKAEILNESLHEARIIHRRSWFHQMKELFEAHPEKQ